MKLKRIFVLILSIILAVIIGLFEYYYVRKEATSNFQTVIIAKKDINIGDKIKEDDISTILVDKIINPDIISNKNIVIDKYSKYEIKAGQNILMNMLTDSDISKEQENTNKCVIKIEQTPSQLLLNTTKPVTLLFISNNNTEKIVYPNIKVKSIYDVNGNEINIKNMIDQNIYKNIIANFIQIEGELNQLTDIKAKEKTGNYSVIVQ